VRRTSEPAQTPFERLSAAAILTNELQSHLEAIFAALDPIGLLDQIGRLQDALWQHAVVRTGEMAAPQIEAPVRYPDVQLRTLQRRIAKWRASVITMFDDQWLQEEVLADAKLPRPLRAVSAPDNVVAPPAT
jgi:hypothetical protein